jgi:isoleucyl-tRNA synthetase
MKYKAGTRRKAIEYEKALVEYWRDHRTFEQSVEQRSKDNRYVFYDGPPFITGVPHHGTLLSSIVKDAVPRYWTMQGKRVERVWGWDCHGLPAEVFTEKKLGIHDKRDVGTKISLEEYITTCRDNMVQTGSLWEDTIARIGRWVDFQGAYKTMDKDYMESVWWAFKQLYDKGKIYEGEKVLLYCTRDATPISKAEVAMDNSYQDVTDPSVYVKFKLTDQDAYLLAWTTTPWTLPANTAVAVNPAIVYVNVTVDGQQFILAKELLDKVLIDEQHNAVSYTINDEFLGKQLIGKQYEPLFMNRGKNAHKVWGADYVTLEEGTGLVHLAPAYGEEDFALAKAHDFPVVSNLDDSGFYIDGPWAGQYVWDANKPVAKQLHADGVVWKIDYITHSYPHCHRCGTKLMYRAHPSWFMDIAGQRTEMLEQNSDINWFPSHIKQGRFAKTVQSAPDWNISRDRFWATAMPVWKGVTSDGEVRIKVVGSYTELKELSGVELDDYHRPWIDDVTFTIDGVKYQRIDKVLDCWFESGSMPFAQFHYPFENRDKFEADFPGDFIAEYVGQVRAWFYYVHAVNVGLFDKNAFKNVIVTGTIAGNDGRKMSKSYGNYTDPNELMDTYSADALRFLLLSSPLLNGEDFSLQDKDVADVNRKLAMIWNMYDFFTMYAEVDGWEWDGTLQDPGEELANSLDQWIVSRVHQLVGEIEQHMNAYDIPNATKAILPFIDDASNWYVRRSRRRFWKSANDEDKQQAYRTLHYVLVRLAVAMAPFTPFLSEELYQKLTGGESVHLLDWLPAGHVNDAVVSEMAEVREYVTAALAIRAQQHIKVRQPLALLSVPNLGTFVDYAAILKDEVNVKQVEQASQLELDVHLTPTLRQEGQAREIIRYVQAARKAAGLQIDDRISLSLQTDVSELRAVIDRYQDTIGQEVLAATIGAATKLAFTSEVKIDGHVLTISLERAG